MLRSPLNAGFEHSRGTQHARGLPESPPSGGPTTQSTSDPERTVRRATDPRSTANRGRGCRRASSAHVWGTDSTAFQRGAGGTLGAVLFAAGVADDYNNRCAEIEDPTERLLQSATRETVVTGGGAAGSAVGFEASTALAAGLLACPETAGAGCVVAAVALVGSATIGGGFLGSQGAGSLYDYLYEYGSSNPNPVLGPAGRRDEHSQGSGSVGRLLMIGD